MDEIISDLIDISIKLFFVTCFIGLALYTYFSHKLKYFERKGLRSYPAFPFVGCFGPVFFQTRSFPEQVQLIYNELKCYKIAGIFDFSKPSYFIKDPDALKQVLIKDFDHFVDRHNVIPLEANNFFTKSVGNLEGHRWHGMRTTLSPAFTSSKMKNMFSLISDCGKQMADHLEKRCKTQEDDSGEILNLDLKDFWTRYTNDVIATCAFGVECNSLRNPENEFYKSGLALSDFGGLQAFAFIGYFAIPRLMNFLNIPLLNRRAENFFTSLIREAIVTRRKKDIVRPDMIHLLMQAQKGSLKAEPSEEDETQNKGNAGSQDLTEEDIIAQAFAFFLAGFDTVATTISFASYFLTTNRDVQDKLQGEIDTVLENNDKRITYESVQKMKYLHMVISETLRMCPPGISIDRKCVKDYRIPPTGSNPEVVIKKGEGIWIPIYGLHHDPEYFPNPEIFDPERFNEENIHNVKPCTYLPFGMGPRNCVGMRFALLEVKIALVYLLSRFNLRAVKKTQDKLAFSANTFNMTLSEGFFVGVTLRR